MNALRRAVLALMFAAAVPAVFGQDFWLRNTDRASVFYWWALPVQPALTAPAVLPRLPLAPGGRHAAAPGERVRVTLASGQMLVGAFVPWLEGPAYLSPVAGGFLLPGEFPAKGTVLADAASFAASNRGRALNAPLQAWGLDPPAMALGRSADWDRVLPALEWGGGFRPDSRPWPAELPRPRSLQVTDRDGALWIRLTADGGWPAGSVSLVFRRPGAFLEWPLSGGTVWLWPGPEAQPVGWGVAGADFEAWIPWDRLGGGKEAWTAAKGGWALAVTAGGTVQAYDLGPFSLGELP